jgi:hypothetical protein
VICPSLRAALVEIGGDGVAVEGFAGDQRLGIKPVGKRGHADGV